VNTVNVFAAAVTVGTLSLVGAPAASAEDATVTITGIGGQAELVDGPIVQGWTVSELAPSTDAIPYPVQGTLWEAVATDQAIQGTVTPIIPDLNARAENGETYPALWQVASPQGINPATLAQGQETTGKIYFDVTGAEPNSVVYNSEGQDLAVWLQQVPEVIIDELDVTIGDDEVNIDETQVTIGENDVTVDESDVTVEGT